MKKVHALCGGDPYPMSIPGMVAHERLVESLLSKSRTWRAWLDLARDRSVGSRRSMRDPTAKRAAILQEKKTKYVKIRLKLQVADP